MFWSPFLGHRHVLVPVAAAVTTKHRENVVLMAYFIWCALDITVVMPLVLYRLRGRDLLRKQGIYWENKGSMRNRAPTNSQSYFSILLAYGLNAFCSSGSPQHALVYVRMSSYISVQRNRTESNPWPAHYQAQFPNNRAITAVLVWSGFKPIVFFFRFFIMKCLYILNSAFNNWCVKHQDRALKMHHYERVIHTLYTHQPHTGWLDYPQC